MPTQIFIESGTDDTGDLSAYSSDTGAGTADSDSSQSYTGSKSLKLTTDGVSNAIVNTSGTVLADSGRRISIRFRTDKIPTTTTGIIHFHVSDGSTFIFAVNLTSAGKLQAAPQGATAVTGATTLAVNTWYRIAISYTITSTILFRFDVRLNGSVEASATLGVLNSTGTGLMKLRANAVMGAGHNWFDDIYVDDGSDYSDPGDYRVFNNTAFILVPLTQSVSDNAANLLDSGDMIEYGEPVWLDTLLDTLGLTKIFNEDLNSWLDANSRIFGYEKVFTDDLNNWLDNLINDFRPLLELSDDGSANWIESLAIGYGISLTDDLNSWLDNLFTSGFFTLDIGDSLNNWFEDLALGYGILLGDDLNSWLELLEINLSAVNQTIIANEDLNNWLDAFTTFYIGNLTVNPSDSTVDLADAISLLYSYEVSNLGDDLNLWDDRFQVITDLILSDSFASFIDIFTVNLDYLKDFSDDLNNLNDAIALIFGYLKDISEDIDNLTDDYSQAVVGIIVDLTLDINDDESGNWNDAYSSLMTAFLQQVITDDLNVWLDVLALGYGIDLFDNAGADWLDQLYLGTELNLTDDANNLVESVFPVLGFELPLSDDLNVWLDAILTSITTARIDLVIAEDLNNWLDAFVIGNLYSLIINETINFWLDNYFSNQFDLSDSLNFWTDEIALLFHIGLELEDNLGFWASDFFAYNFDAVEFDALVADRNYYRRYVNDVYQLDISQDVLGIIPLVIVEDINSLVDSLGSTVGISVGTELDLIVDDTIGTLLDSFTSSFPGIFIAINEDLNNWLDAIDFFNAYSKEISEDINSWVDQIDFLYNLGIVATDDLNLWLDQLDAGMVVGLAIDDDGSANWLDAIASLYGFGLVLADDNSANWNEAIVFIYGYEKDLSDDESSNWLDAISFIEDYGLVLSDDGSANWGN